MVNWRFWGWFFQLESWASWAHWWRGDLVGRPWRFSHVPGRPKRGEAWVSIYQGRVHFALTLLALVLLVLWIAS